jgi:hypothetical protein
MLIFTINLHYLNMETSNDNALLDCIYYAVETRHQDEGEFVCGTRPITGGPPTGSDKECVITMCGNDEQEEGRPPCRLIRVCPNGHYMHDRCIEFLMRNATSEGLVCCPMCKSREILPGVLDSVAGRNIDTDVFCKLFAVDAMAELVLQIGAQEVRSLSLSL